MRKVVRTQYTPLIREEVSRDLPNRHLPRSKHRGKVLNGTLQVCFLKENSKSAFSYYSKGLIFGSIIYHNLINQFFSGEKDLQFYFFSS